MNNNDKKNLETRPDQDDRPFIRIEKLHKDFGDFTAVDGIDLDIRQGELFAMSETP